MMACLQALLMQTTLAYNKENRLVDYRDRITIFNSTDPNTVSYAMDLMSFPYMTDFE